MKVKEIMVQPVTTVNEDTTLEEIAKTMLKKRIGCVPVVDAEGKLVGIITESDFTAEEQALPFSRILQPQVFGKWISKEGMEEIYKAARTMVAKEIMTTSVVTVTEDEPIEEAVRKLFYYDINRLPVVRDNVPIAMLTRHDLLKLMIEGKDPKRLA